MPRKLLIVGAGMACAYLLEDLSRQQHDYSITVIGEEAQVCYNRVLLSNVLCGESGESDLEMLDKGREGIQFTSSTTVEKIETHARCVTTTRGEQFYYDRLVLATGSSVARPTVDCSGVKGVEEFRTLEDARHLRSLRGAGKRAVVLGGGLLGLEAAHGLNGLGFETTVLHRNAVPMNRQLDTAGGHQLQLALEARGIYFELGASIKKLQTGNQQIQGIELNSGKRLPCDLLLFATGIIPNTQLALKSGIDCSRGVLVDDYLRSSQPGIYALGECCQHGDYQFGLIAPIRQQAKVLAQQLCGTPDQGFSVEDYPTQLKISGVEIYRAGELDDKAEQLILHDEVNGIYRRLVIRDDRLVGAVLVGDKRGGTWYSELIAEQRALGGLRNGLMFGRDVSEAMLASAA